MQPIQPTSVIYFITFKKQSNEKNNRSSNDDDGFIVMGNIKVSGSMS
jgi:hypothetical protein